jgi:hypothetical protein
MGAPWPPWPSKQCRVVSSWPVWRNRCSPDVELVAWSPLPLGIEIGPRHCTIAGKFYTIAFALLDSVRRTVRGWWVTRGDHGEGNCQQWRCRCLASAAVAGWRKKRHWWPLIGGYTVEIKADSYPFVSKRESLICARAVAIRLGITLRACRSGPWICDKMAMVDYRFIQNGDLI